MTDATSPVCTEHITTSFSICKHATSRCRLYELPSVSFQGW